MKIVQAKASIYKKKPVWSWKKLNFVPSNELVLFKENVDVNLSIVTDRVIAVRSNGLVFSYDPKSNYFVNSRGDKIAFLYLEAGSPLRLL